MDTDSLFSKPGAPRNRAILVLVWFLFYSSFTLFTPPLLDDADSVHAEVAREMLLRHDWTTLYANGIRYLEKAPLHYWLMAASFKLFGPTTAASRLPLGLTVLLLALLMELFARRAFQSTRAGLYAALILLSSFGIFIFTRINIPDAMVCLWLTLALFAYWQTEQQIHPQRVGTQPPLHARNLTPISTDSTDLKNNSEDDHGATRSNTEQDPIRENPRPSAAQSVPSVQIGVMPLAHAPSFTVSSRRVGTTIATEPSRLLCWLFAAACALNVLTKGLIGIVFPILIVLLHLALTRRSVGAVLQRIRQLHPISSIFVFLAVAVPWHILIALANPTQGHPGSLAFAHGHWTVPLPTDGNVHGWLWFYFINEQVLRYLNLRVPRDYDTVPLVLFWGLVLIWLMPWSAYLFKAIARVPFRKALRPRLSIRTLTPTESTLLLLGIWAAVPLVFFSFSTRQEYYVLPSLPPLVLLIAAWLADEAVEAESFAVPSPLTQAGRRISVVLLALGAIAALVAGFFILHAQPMPANTDLASLLRQNPGDYALSFGHFLDLDTRAMGAFERPLLLAAIALFGGALANWLLRRNDRPHAANLWLAAGAFGFLLAAHMGLQIFSPVLTSEQLAEAIAPQLHPDDLIVIHGEYEAASTLGFYLHRPAPGTTPIHILNGRSSNLWYGSFFPDAPAIFEDNQSIALKWSGIRRVFLWQDLSDPLPPLPGKVWFIAQSGGKEILSNHPSPY